MLTAVAIALLFVLIHIEMLIEESYSLPGVSPAHTLRGVPGQGFVPGRTPSTAIVLSRRMESNTFIGRVHPSMQQFSLVRGGQFAQPPPSIYAFVSTGV